MKKRKKIISLLAASLCTGLIFAGCDEKTGIEPTPEVSVTEGATNLEENSEPTKEVLEPTKGAETDEKTPEQDTKENIISMQEKVLYEKDSLFAEQKNESWIFTNGKMRLEYNVNTGTAQIFTQQEEMPLLSEVYAKAVLKDGAELASKELKRDGENSITVSELSDGFGEGMQIRIENKGEKINLTQCYSFYKELPYFLCEAVLSTDTEEGISTNYIAPVYACKGDYKTNVLSVTGEDVDRKSVV